MRSYSEGEREAALKLADELGSAAEGRAPARYPGRLHPGLEA
jgi:hypothetical protein